MTRHLHQDFRHAALSAASPEVAWDVTCRYLAGFGFDGVFFADQTRGAIDVRSNIDASWAQYAAEEGVLSDDPFFTYCFKDRQMMRTGAEYLSLHPDLTAAQVAFIRSAGETGLRAGVSVPVRLPYEGGLSGWHLLSSHGRDTVQAAWAEDVEELRLSLLVVQHSLPGAHAPRPTALSPRERDCLLWCAEGARNALIADRLGISESTVEFHLRNARKKLGARTREHAISLAFRTGLMA